MEIDEFIKDCPSVDHVVVDECTCSMLTTATTRLSTLGEYFYQLPKEILMLILLETANTSSLKEILQLTQLSKSFYLLIRSPQIWKHIAKKFEVNMIPLHPLCSLCSFHRNYDAQFCKWNAKRSSPNITIDNNQIINNRSGWNTAVFGRPLTKGRHEFIFTIIKCMSIMFGVQSIRRSTTTEYIWPGSGSIGITSTNDSIACYSSYGGAHSFWLDGGVVIKMIVDLDTRTVLFFRNNQLIKFHKHLIAAKWETSDPMEVVVLFCSAPNRVQFNSYRRRK